MSDAEKNAVYIWLSFNPNKDAFDAAEALGISDASAVQAVNALLAEGLLEPS